MTTIDEGQSENNNPQGACEGGIISKGQLSGSSQKSEADRLAFTIYACVHVNQTKG